MTGLTSPPTTGVTEYKLVGQVISSICIKEKSEHCLCRYLTSAHGELNTAEQAPEEGSYTGVHRSGGVYGCQEEGEDARSRRGSKGKG